METILTTLLEDALDEVQNMCDTWVYEELGAEFDRLAAELDQVKYDMSVKHDMAAEQIDELTKELDRLNEQLNSKQDALSAALLALDYAVSRVMELEAECDRYKQGVEVETIVHSNGSSWAGFDAYVHVQVPLAWSQQRVRVLVMKVEE